MLPLFSLCLSESIIEIVVYVIYLQISTNVSIVVAFKSYNDLLAYSNSDFTILTIEAYQSDPQMCAPKIDP